MINFLLSSSRVTGGQSTPVSLQVDAAKPVDDMKRFRAFFGYDAPNSMTRKDGQPLLTELQQLSPVPVFVRTHNLLTSKGESPPAPT